jgi:1-hydroxycarotenoid 3,4-desaturase
MLIAHVEQDGVWSVEGGMHALARALEALAIRRGAAFHHDAEVSEILSANGSVSGVRLRTGAEIAASAVIANADAAALASGLFGSAAARGLSAIPAEARSLSAVTWAAVARTSGFPLTRHNVFFSCDYEREFRDLAHGVANDPTVYVCAQDRDGACDGPERLLMLVNAPAHGDVAAVAIRAAEQAMRRRIDACGLSVDWQPQDCAVTDPAGFARLLPATGGALYGRASHGWMASFRRPGAATALPGLYLAGGSVHPGPGVPMAALSGRLAVDHLLGDRASTRRFHPGATAGGTSTRSATMAVTD